MNINVIETSVDKLHFETNSCVSFYAPENARDTLQDCSTGISGVIIIEYDDGRTCSAKFTYSPLGDDGNVEMITGHYLKDSFFVKQAVVSHAVYKAKNQGS